MLHSFTILSGAEQLEGGNIFERTLLRFTPLLGIVGNGYLLLEFLTEGEALDCWKTSTVDLSDCLRWAFLFGFGFCVPLS